MRHGGERQTTWFSGNTSAVNVLNDSQFPAPFPLAKAVTNIDIEEYNISQAHPHLSLPLAFASMKCKD